MIAIITFLCCAIKININICLKKNKNRINVLVSLILNLQYIYSFVRIAQTFCLLNNTTNNDILLTVYSCINLDIFLIF